MKADSGGGKYETPPPGSHPAVLVALVDLGTQKVEYGDDEQWKKKVYLVWELTDEQVPGTKGVNHLIGKDFTFSFNSKSMLRGYVQKWRGKDFADGEDFDLFALLGKSCMLTVVHQTKGDRTYAKVDGVSPLHKSMTVPPARREPVAWLLGSGEPLPDWLPYLYGRPVADHVKAARENSAGAGTANGTAAKDEPIPEGEAIAF